MALHVPCLCLALLWALLWSAPLAAQQLSPADQLAQAQAMVSTLYRQLNTAIQDSAQQEAARMKMQADLDKLKAQVSELQKKGKDAPQAQAQDERKETR